MSIEYANEILGSKMNLYKMVKALGWFVPEYASKAVTVQYLNYVMNGAVFRMKKTDMKRHSLEVKSYSAMDLVGAIETKLGHKMGFELQKLPNREYLLDVLFTLDDQHEVFQGNQEKLVEVPLEFLKNLCFVNPGVSKSSQPLLNLSKEERLSSEKLRIQKKGVKLERRKLMMVESIKGMEKSQNSLSKVYTEIEREIRNLGEK